ncbi:hypothetical protein P879_09429 [Paragonimus westermani]|uniref:Uncharacterized protein n=1 Tax=Paragonimus westermani TaxID=34504 RepID=A0A8T0DHM2_9TREM|nr:hypothetical protein P879_09429 [Paragonimus westermani]
MPKSPGSNPSALLQWRSENVIRTAITPIASVSPKTLRELETSVDDLLLKYRTTAPTITTTTAKEIPTRFFKSCGLRPSLHHSETSGVTYFRDGDSHLTHEPITRQIYY